MSRCVDADIDHTDGHEGRQDDEEEVSKRVDCVQDFHCLAGLAPHLAEVPEAAIAVRERTQDGAEESNEPTDAYEDAGPALVDVEVVPQRVDDPEVLVDTDQEDAEDGGGAHKAGGALGEVAQQMPVGG